MKPKIVVYGNIGKKGCLNEVKKHAFDIHCFCVGLFFDYLNLEYITS